VRRAPLGRLKSYSASHFAYNRTYPRFSRKSALLVALQSAIVTMVWPRNIMGNIPLSYSGAIVHVDTDRDE
jgi:hypothetical protein